ncbi:MAG: carboxylating nicotinate-nucleotide diphosphorylase [Chloroflexi bacterium]|nr:carboxylating nicotinate-nucleotide diphosphorylase [Chloroflexota bacterium]
MFYLTPETESLIDRALTEDLSLGDPTTEVLIPPESTGSADLVAKEEGVLAGLDVGLAVFKRVDATLETAKALEDGAGLEAGVTVASVRGSVSSILMAERTALNFVRRLSGVATETARYVQAVEGYDTRIIDTRKTTPGLRTLDKYAVRAGGGHNHRRNLGDGILIKDNHIAALRAQGLSLGDIVKKAYANASHMIKIEVEVESLDQVREALDAGAEILLLDNMSYDEMAAAVELCKGRAITEASGDVTLERVRQVAATGVDLISVGALTHSVNALNISLDLD